MPNQAPNGMPNDTDGQRAPAPEPPPLVLVAPAADAADAERTRRSLRARFGDGFPLANMPSTPTADDGTGQPGQPQPPDDAEWASWLDAEWDRNGAMSATRVHLARRNRMIRDGNHWVASFNGGAWGAPPRAANKVRAVVDVIGPALDWRLQVQTEQRPGVHAVPATRDPEAQRRATASNAVLEHLMRASDLQEVRREAGRWAQTDGVSFLYGFWDPDAGPLMRDDASGRVVRAGEFATRVLTIEQVRVTPNATATVAPRAWFTSEEMPLAEAIAEFGDDVVDEGSGGGSGTRGAGLVATATGQASIDARRRPDVDHRLQGHATVRKRMAFCAPCDALPKGLCLVVVGRKVVALSGLLGGQVPLVRYADGSSDPAFFCVPQMEAWIPGQMRLNKAYSLLLQNIATNAGGRFAFREGTVKGDALAGGQDVLVPIRSASAIDDVFRPIQGFSVGADALTVIEREIKMLEDATGYNDVARGGISSQSSGKAVYAIREQIERVFAPGVYAECRGVKGWSRVALAVVATCYQVPRAIRTLGKSRPDLGRLITGDDVDAESEVELDPETLMPTPASVKRAQLDDLFDKGLVRPHEYVRRFGYAVLDGIEYPDETQANRAYRYVDALRELEEAGQDPALADQAEPLLWQDDEGIWQEVLDREVILAPDVHPALRAAAIDRWTALAHQAQEKAQASPMGGSVPSPMDPMNPDRAALAPPPAPPPMLAPNGVPNGVPNGPPNGVPNGPPNGMPPAPTDPNAFPPPPPPGSPPGGGSTSGGSPLPMPGAPTLAMPGSPLPTPPLLQQQLAQHLAAQFAQGQPPAQPAG